MKKLQYNLSSICTQTVKIRQNITKGNTAIEI